MDDQSNLLVIFHISQIYQHLDKLRKEKEEIEEIRILLDGISSITYNESDVKDPLAMKPLVKPHKKEKKMIKCTHYTSVQFLACD